MPSSPLSLCAEPGCPVLVKHGRCAEHLTEFRRDADKLRPNGYQRGYTAQWAKFRAEYLTFHPYCVSEKHIGQRVPATDVDHIDGTGRNGPRAYDEGNLQPLCHSCHSSKTAQYDGGFGFESDEMPWSPKQKCATPTCRNLVDRGWCEDCQRKNVSEARITVIAGPPASGKTTYVQQHKTDNDLVIDLDAIAIALGSNVSHDHNPRLLPFMFAARDAILQRISRPNDIDHVWVIRTAPLLKDRHEWWQATVIVLAKDADTCKAQAAAAGRPAQWNQLIDDWWDQYQPSSNDTIIT